MAPSTTTTAEKLQHPAAWALGVAGLLSAVTSLIQATGETAVEVGKTASTFQDLGWWLGVPVGLLLIAVGLYVGFTKSSRLLEVDALRIDPDNPAHLIGRDEKIEQLQQRCRDSDLVHLVGESGAGKSALARSGLVPALRDDDSLLPVYTNTWGQDWELGPRTGLTEAVWKSLDDAARDKLKLSKRPEPKQLDELLTRLQSELGRTPLLIFDQFDDYQARHRDRFLVEETQTILPTDQLLNDNPFWSDINGLLTERLVRCLFVTRADTAAGLESVRFIEPQVFPLERPRSNIIGPLLRRLTEGVKDKDGNDVEVIRHPEHGWERLMERVAADLNEDGHVLPVRLRLVLQGLSELKKLTPGAYDAAGGCIGLEAGFIESKVRSAARVSRAEGVTDKQVRDVLLKLVDREKLKTVGKPASELQVG